jgi:hypothetical protein
MKAVRSICIALLGGCAIAAATAASAFAEAPEFGRCVAKAGGHFLDSGCKTPSIPGKEKFEWEPGVVDSGFHSTLKEGIPTIETAGLTKITCHGEETSGKISGPKTVGNVVITLTSCESSACAVSGNVTTHPLAGVLGVEKVGETPAKSKLALELHAESGNVAEFECFGLPIIVRGTVLRPLTANKMATTAIEKYAQKGGEQKPDHFAGGVADEHTLEGSAAGGPFEEVGLAFTSTLTYEEKLEASSVN